MADRQRNVMESAEASARGARVYLESVYGDGSIEQTFVRALMVQHPTRRAAEVEKLFRGMGDRWPILARPLAAAYLRSGQPIPPILAATAAEILAGGRAAPKDRKKTGRDTMIAAAVTFVAKEHGISATGGDSASVAVAAAWGVSDKTVEAAWTKWTKGGRDDAEFLSSFAAGLVIPTDDLQSWETAVSYFQDADK